MLDIQKVKKALDTFSKTDPDEVYEIRIVDRKKPRFYLGMSAIGDPCRRKLWYGFRKCAKEDSPDGRMLRLWRRGDREEYHLVFLLRGIGFTVYDVDENGKQFSMKDVGGHFSGHSDGVGIAPATFWTKGCKPHPFLLEFKTYNDRRFKELKKNKVEVSDPKYYAQMQCYMGYEGLKGALFIAVNKNDDEIYFEWVPFSKKDFQNLQHKAEDIINETTPPDRMTYASPVYYYCKWCSAYDICHNSARPEKNCHSCFFASPVDGGKWECRKGQDFGEVCRKYKPIVSR